ncbi:DUF6527 family protein [Anaeroselena agilis]|uniref:DUF6527 family protein n=1 Tax=Anaeroselena agilis TaxID=3063788 RepID=A0ABU3NYD9_9FIRM|nr:DUF6527 family protein [Selenomonadales bacterium 4137-cl]
MAKAKISQHSVRFWCPGCKSYHLVSIKPANPNGWDFAGDAERPTLSPSILVNGIAQFHNPAVPRCHSFVREGKIQFLSDCTHELAGQTVELPEVEEGE